MSHYVRYSLLFYIILFILEVDSFAPGHTKRNVKVSSTIQSISKRHYMVLFSRNLGLIFLVNRLPSKRFSWNISRREWCFKSERILLYVGRVCFCKLEKYVCFIFAGWIRSSHVWEQQVVGSAWIQTAQLNEIQAYSVQERHRQTFAKTCKLILDFFLSKLFCNHPH